MKIVVTALYTSEQIVNMHSAMKLYLNGNIHYYSSKIMNASISICI